MSLTENGILNALYSSLAGCRTFWGVYLVLLEGEREKDTFCQVMHIQNVSMFTAYAIHGLCDGQLRMVHCIELLQIYIV